MHKNMLKGRIAEAQVESIFRTVEEHETIARVLFATLASRRLPARRVTTTSSEA